MPAFLRRVAMPLLGVKVKDLPSTCCSECAASPVHVREGKGVGQWGAVSGRSAGDEICGAVSGLGLVRRGGERARWVLLAGFGEEGCVGAEEVELGVARREVA